MFGEPKWVKRLESKLDLIIQQNNLDKQRDIRIAVADQERDYYIMAQVQIAQEDLDSTASALRSLVEKVNSIDLTVLPAADQSALVSAVADLTSAVNTATGDSTPNVPAPNPEPEPTETPAEVPAEGGSNEPVPTEQPTPSNPIESGEQPQV